MKDRNWNLLKAVERTENVALQEICGVDLILDLPKHEVIPGENLLQLPKVLHS